MINKMIYIKHIVLLVVLYDYNFTLRMIFVMVCYTDENFTDVKKLNF